MRGDVPGSSGTACPACGELGSAVKDSRPANGGVRRRRDCIICGHRYTTHEYSREALQDWARRQRETIRHLYDLGDLSPEARAAVTQVISLLRAGEKKEKINGYQEHERPEGARREDGFHPAA